jgi:uncharacterized protein YecT (DUF1311 family)
MWTSLILFALAAADPAQSAGGYVERGMTDRQILAVDCEQANLGADRAVGACWSAQAQFWQKRVRQEYAAALARVDPEMRKPLRSAQKAWERYAAAQCRLWEDVKGTLSARLPPRCVMELNKARAEELRKLEGLSG